MTGLAWVITVARAAAGATATALAGMLFWAVVPLATGWHADVILSGSMTPHIAATSLTGARARRALRASLWGVPQSLSAERTASSRASGPSLSIGIGTRLNRIIGGQPPNPRQGEPCTPL